MEQLSRSICNLEPEHPISTNIKATLFELIETISDEIKPGEDRLIPAIVLNLVETGRVKQLGEDMKPGTKGGTQHGGL